MFPSLAAALAFLLLLLPGLLLVAGFNISAGNRSGTPSALEALVQGVAWSVVLLLPAVFVIGDQVASWAVHDKLNDHVHLLGGGFYGTMFGAFGIGWLAGKWGWLQRKLQAGTTWSGLSASRSSSEEPMVTVTLKEGGKIRGRLDLKRSRYASGSHIHIYNTGSSIYPAAVIAAEEVASVVADTVVAAEEVTSVPADAATAPS
jgi:hypothetical protein